MGCMWYASYCRRTFSRPTERMNAAASRVRESRYGPLSNVLTASIIMPLADGGEGTLDVLLRAWALWGPSAPRLEIIGGGPDLNSLARSLPGALGGVVAFLGRLSREETWSRLSRAMLVVMPSVCFEAFPLVLLEAFGFGVPVLASRLGAFPGLVEECGAGRLFAPALTSDGRRLGADVDCYSFIVSHLHRLLSTACRSSGALGNILYVILCTLPARPGRGGS